MKTMIMKRSKKAGLSPGTLIHIGGKKIEKEKITFTRYNDKFFEEKEVETIEECFIFSEEQTVTWINISGIHDVEIIDKVGKHFDVHPLVLEDIVNTEQRPKMEDFENYIFVILKILQYDENKRMLKSEQVSIVLSPYVVISFQESEGAIFQNIRMRLKNGKGRIRRMGADYLAYALIDTIIDHYFIILEKLGDTIEGLEEEVVTSPGQKTAHEIHELKREISFLRRSIWPLRELISGMERGETTLICESTRIYLRDVYDHTIQIMEVIETMRDTLLGMFDVYISSISNKMNEIMKILTIITTIFIPLTLITGIYGMNFKCMPELEWDWGYYGALFLMVGIGSSLFAFFKKRKWL
ncbi:MAG: magnesium/cobalt transporter CorA [Thermodesulfobacteriota bacterium]|nr:magnesium/cobalt transporter CorA [Thermodesulfobacteriota bacterium]